MKVNQTVMPGGNVITDGQRPATFRAPQVLLVNNFPHEGVALHSALDAA